MRPLTPSKLDDQRRPYAVLATGRDHDNYTDTGLTGGTTYYYMVSALNLVGGNANSAPAGATTLRQPRIVAAALAGGGLVFSATNGSPGGGYTVRSTTNLAARSPTGCPSAAASLTAWATAASPTPSTRTSRRGFTC